MVHNLETIEDLVLEPYSLKLNQIFVRNSVESSYIKAPGIEKSLCDVSDSNSKVHKEEKKNISLKSRERGRTKFSILSTITRSTSDQ